MKSIIFFAAIILTSCAMQNQSVVREPAKDGSIETVIAVRHYKGYDLLTTTHKVWINNMVDRVITQSDTLKPLGNVTKRVDDGWGGEKTRTFPKAYEVYITVK
ncbi:MAG TPA: hypothetical protein VNX01_03835 [Bacteroidia bacterium]|nr:hypothetical protein [Bacteroidia bacterium]